MPQLAWYLKRLRVMSGREVLHRLGQQVTLTVMLAQYRLGPAALPRAPASATLRFRQGQTAQLPPLQFDLDALKSATPDLLDGKVSVFGQTWQWKQAPGVWHCAPDTGRTWPMRFFAGIPYRDGNPFGDIRHLWEPARLQHLVDLAVIASTASQQEREKALDLVETQLCSWVADNPPLTGAHYISSMECALRLIALCHTLDILRNDLKNDAPWAALSAIVTSHAPLIARRLSLHSSTGNHTTAEAAALVYAGILFTESKDAEKRLSTGLSILQALSDSQVLPDGGGIEQALTYHRFNIQLLALVQSLLTQHGKDVPLAISEAVDRGKRYLAAMSHANGQLLPIGDSDGGCALSNYLMPFTHDAEPAKATQSFDDSGYTLAHIGSKPAMRLTFDHGPLGMPPSFGHGHADSLAVTLAAGDEDILVDTGTYTYTGDQKWRHFFRGTRAHNTVTVNHADQANQEACFLWSRPYRSRLIKSEIANDKSGRVIASHDGYAHCGVSHTRGIAWAQDQWLLIWDCLIGEGNHQLELHWHLGKEPIWNETGLFTLKTTSGQLRFQCAGGIISSHRAETSPILGWQSPSYGILEPITTVKVRHSGALPHTFTTLIRLPGNTRSDINLKEALKWMTEQTRFNQNG